MGKTGNVMALKYAKAMGDNSSVVSNGTIYDSIGYIDTGNYLLNAQISKSIHNGIPSNKITMFAGEESTGKTFLLLGVIRHYLDSDKNNIVVFFESEGAINKKILESRGIDTTRVVLKSVDSVEEFRHASITFLDNYLKDDPDERPKVFMCLDSLGMLPSSKETNDALAGNDKSDMTRPKILKSVFRILTVKLAAANIAMVVTNHVYATMDMYGAPQISGGSGCKYAASTIVMLTKGNYKEDGDGHESKSGDHMGISVGSTLIKSRDTRQKKKIKFVIHVKKGLDYFSGLFEFCYEEGLIEKRGRSYFWASEGEESKALFKKVIMDDLKGFFNKQRLKELDKYCIKYFGYGD